MRYVRTLFLFPGVIFFALCAKAQGSELHYANVVRLLLANGANVNAKNDHKRHSPGETPLFAAAARNDKEIAGLLLAKGAEVNARNRSSRVPLHFAAQRGAGEVAKLLLVH